MRKEKVVTITAKGRDTNKQFHLTEMDAERAEEWGMRALLALARGGVELPEGIERMGLAGIAVVGVKALGQLDYDVAKPLLQQMMDCVQIIPDPSKPQVRRTLVPDDIEDVKTRLELRREVIDLHIDFFTDAGLLSQARGQALSAK